jgi:hypothetical protein
MKAPIRFAACFLIAIVLLFSLISSAKTQSTSTSSFSSQYRGLGKEYQLSNSMNPEMDRYHPASAYNKSNHQTLVVWHRNLLNSYFIEGRLTSASGQPLGTGPTVFASGQTPVYQPAVAYNAADNQYLLVWMRNTNLDGKTYAIWGKILNADLTDAKAEFMIFDPAANYSLWSPRLAWNPVLDEFMVVWTGYDISAYPNMTPDDLSQETVAYDGSLVGHILVIGNTQGNMIYPQEVDLVFANNDNKGKYMWVWHQRNPNTYNSEIWAANIDAWAGGYLQPLPPFRVDGTTSEKAHPSIATNGANNFMLVWQEHSPVAPYDWDIYGQQIDQNGSLLGNVNYIASQGSTDETDPFAAAWPAPGIEYVVGYERQSATGQDIYLAYDNNGANTIPYANFTFWLDVFPAAAYGFWTNSYPTGVISGAHLQFAYQGVSTTPQDHTQIYTRTWTPYLAYLPTMIK